MIRTKSYRIILLFLTGVLVYLQQVDASGIGYITKLNIDNNKLNIEVGAHRLYIEVCAENILKVDFRPFGKSSPATPVIAAKEWPVVPCRIESGADPVVIKTDKMEVRIKKHPCRISVYDSKGNLLLKEQALVGVFAGGLKLEHASNDLMYGIYGFNRDDFEVNLLRPEGGYIQAKPQGGCGAPFVWSTKGYGVIVDTDGGDIYNNDGKLSFNNCSRQNVEYYVMTGTPKEILAAAGHITGMPPMFPKWNMGYGQLEWGIDEAEFKSHIEGYRKRNIPIDWFMLDFDWMAWGEDNYGELRWGKKFPSGATGELKKWMDHQGLKMTAITKPRVVAKNTTGTWTAQGKYAEDHHFWYPGESFFPDYVTKADSKDLDYSIPECRTWWWEHLKGAYETGMIGFLNDECDDSNAGGLYSLGNLSNMYMQQSIYEGQRSISNQRVWSVNRTSYLGAQRLAYGIWSGDNYASYKDLRSQVGKMLAANNILVSTWGFCVSAFWHHKPPLTSEFYIRAMQTGMFAPLFFVHGNYGQNRQPWVMGAQAETRAKEAIHLRYSLIPYIYSYERAKHETAIGISRSLVLEFPDDPQVADHYESFLWGDYILAAPVIDSAQTVKRIYFPEGTWTDFKTGKQYAGKQTHTFEINNQTLEDIPMFIRNGAIIPSQEVLNYVGEKKVDQIFVDVFPDGKASEFMYYDDDGNSYDYEKGIFMKQRFVAQNKNSSVSLMIEGKTGQYTPDAVYYVVKVHGKKAKSAIQNKKKLKLVDMNTMSGKNEECWAPGTDKYGDVTMMKLKAASPTTKNISLQY